MLNVLSAADYAQLAGHLRSEELSAGHVFYEAEDQVDTVWFPETGMASVISPLLSGAMIETAVVGCEGAVGFVEACGSGVTFSRVIVQAPGRFSRLPAGAYREAFGRSESLRLTIHDHIELLLTEARQAIACKALHAVEQRMAWWLLETQDRLGGSAQLPLTQEFLATLMGVQRTTVTEKAHQLQAEGLIQYRRGRIDVVNRGGLERKACECYATTQHFRDVIEARRPRARDS